ncbi:uncharacterized protein G2W53_004065 [Senna tora]|uniref:Uncharacterized protein n=1 Tax=Senna tora TaxID=362788 RepID=A0A834XBP1_9FABA|nr:uncharacterized protein G2W53_004065 [Senna tora]
MHSCRYQLNPRQNSTEKEHAYHFTKHPYLVNILYLRFLEASEEEESPWQPLRWNNRADFLIDGLDRDHGWGPARPHLEGPCSAQPGVSFRARKSSHPLNLNRVNLGRS